MLAFTRWVIPTAQRRVQPYLHTVKPSATSSRERDARRAAAEIDRPPPGIVRISRHTTECNPAAADARHNCGTETQAGCDLNPNLAICSSVSPRRRSSRCALSWVSAVAWRAAASRSDGSPAGLRGHFALALPRCRHSPPLAGVCMPQRFTNLAVGIGIAGAVIAGIQCQHSARRAAAVAAPDVCLC